MSMKYTKTKHSKKKSKFPNFLISNKYCLSSTNLPHLDNSNIDHLLDLVHHHRILRMFLCNLEIFLEINQHLHRQYKSNSIKHA